MAGSGIMGCRRALRVGCTMGGDDSVANGELIPEEVQKGFGTPTHPAPVGTIYVKLDATMGTASHFRCTASTGTWAAMSDD